LERQQLEPVAVRHRDRTVWFLIGLVAGALTLALLKPWGLGSPGSGASGPPSVIADATRESSSAPTSSAAVGPASCFSHTAWRLVTAEHTSGRDIRSWIAIDPVVAIGPSDETLKSVPVVADRLLGIGLCAPPELAAAAGADRAAVLWVPRGRELVTVSLSELQPLAGFGTGEGQLYGPPAELAAASGSWPIGRYLMQLGGDVAQPPVWISFKVSRPPASRASEAP
jgi:hypothetical protein